MFTLRSADIFQNVYTQVLADLGFLGRLTVLIQLTQTKKSAFVVSCIEPRSIRLRIDNSRQSMFCGILSCFLANACKLTYNT